MTPAEWLRRQRGGRETFARNVQAIARTRQLAETYGTTEAVTAAVERAEAVLTAAQAPAPEPPAPQSAPRFVLPVTITDSLVRCGCWPRYVGGCHCGTGWPR